MPEATIPARLRRLAVHAWLACAALAASALHAQGLDATFNTAADIPVTAPSYTAAGTATLTLGFVPTPGTNLTVIKNTGLPFIDGQFTNLPNGGTVTLTHAGTTYPFIAWYYGGEGNNDLVLLWPYTGLAVWGYNGTGQLGNNSLSQRRLPVGAVQTGALLGKTIVRVAGGGGHSLALCSDGTVTAWGDNSEGQLGDDTRINRREPVAVNMEAGTSALAGKTVIAIAAGEKSSLALCSDGTLAAWGLNTYGQLGDDSQTTRLTPVAVNVDPGRSALSGKTVVAITTKYHHCLALCSDGTVAAWGFNSFGQLGDNSATNRLLPVTVNTAAGTSALAGRVVTALAAGFLHSLALCSDGTVAAWGDNDNGQLGNLSPGNVNDVAQRVPVLVNATSGSSALTGRTVVAITVGARHSMALCSDGTVAVWGASYKGQLGIVGSWWDYTWPVPIDVTAGFKVLAGKNVVAIVAGHEFSLALCSDGTLAAWGDDYWYGQLGVNSMARFPTRSNELPQAVDREAGMSVLGGRPISGSAISSGAYHTIAIYGYGPAPSVIQTAERTQTIAFALPSTVYLGQSPLSLSAHASSGLPVTLSVVPAGTTAAGVSIGDTLRFSGPGTVKVQAVQAGGGNYAAAPTVVRIITVKADPTVLTLVNLTQTYTGTPRAISTLGGIGTMPPEYKIGADFGSTAPTNAGLYPVRATDSKGTKTGTLVITKAPLYATPDDQRKFIGDNNPPLTLSYSGLVNGETASVVTTAPALKTAVTSKSIGGLYSITASGGVVSPNYAFIYQRGALGVDSFAGSYEALLINSEGIMGKLVITISSANTRFTGKLYADREKAGLPLTGSLVTSPDFGLAMGSAAVTSSGSPYVVSITVLTDGSLSASVTRSSGDYAKSSTGRRMLTLATGKTVSYSGAHTAVLRPATMSYSDLPKGSGWATAAISTKGVMTLAGRMGDGTSFTTSLLPDNASDPTYRLFVQPYKMGATPRSYSHLSGAFTLLPHPTLAGRRYVKRAALTWIKAGLKTDATYSAGFARAFTVMLLDPWLPPATGFPLADRLGLTNSSFQVLHTDTGSPLNGNLPTRAGLSTTNAVSVTTPTANTTKWKATLVPSTGLFSGSFELADKTPTPRAVTFTGVLRQPATAPDTMIGDGHYLLPPLTGTAKTTGEVMFKRP